MFLPKTDKVRGALTKEDHAKGTLGLIKEGQIGKAVKRATDRRRAYGEIVHREMFNNTSLVSALQAGETDTDSVLKNLANFKPGTAILAAVKFSEMDTTPKQSLVYAGYKAHAAMAARKAKVPRKDRKKWVIDYMKRIPKENPGVHKEAYDTAMAFLFDYSNVPLVISAKDAGQGGRILQRGLFMFSGFIYNYIKHLYQLTPFPLPGAAGAKILAGAVGKGKKDPMGGSEARNAWASAAMFGLGLFMFIKGSEEEEDDEEDKRKKRYAPPMFGSDYDIEGEIIQDWWLGTGGKISVDSLDEIFGTSVANSVRAYLEANGATDAEGMEIWLRGRGLPYVQYLSAFATLGQTLQGKRKWKQTGSQMKELALEFAPSGPLQTLGGVVTKYNERTPWRYRVADIGYDVFTSRLIPSTLRKSAQQYVDPTRRRRRDWNGVWENSLLQHLKRSTPWASKELPPAGRTFTVSVKPGKELPPEHSARIAQLLDMGYKQETVMQEYTDAAGETTFKYIDPETITVVSDGEWMLNNTLRLQGIDKIDRVLANLGLNKDSIEAIQSKRERAVRLEKMGRVVKTADMLTESELIKLQAWDAYQNGADFATFLELKRQRDRGRLDKQINPQTRVIDSAGNETQIRPNRFWSDQQKRELIETLLDRAPKNQFGEYLDPYTGDVIDISEQGKTWHLGHKSGRPWKDIANLPEYRDLTKKQIAEMELNPDNYVIQSPSSNMSDGARSARKPIYKRKLPEEWKKTLMRSF